MNLTLETLLPIAGIVLGAKLMGRLSRRLGIPAILGELLLGLIVGLAILGWLAPTTTLHLLAGIGLSCLCL